MVGDAATPFSRVTLEIHGLGVILYSPFAAQKIAEGEDYFSNHYSDQSAVTPHIVAGTIVGFGVGSPGTYTIEFFRDYPTDDFIASHKFAIRLGMEVRDEQVCVRDLYDLMDWTASCPLSQRVPIRNGFYHITLCSSPPASGILGEDQQIFAFFKRLSQMPEIQHAGIPMLCP